MNKKYMTVNQVSTYSGVTIRTLHYYDELGLLYPSKVSQSNYRLYTQDDLDILQQILFFKEIGFQLKEIKSIIKLPIYEHGEMIEKQLFILQKKREQIDGLIEYVERFIAGEETVDFEFFDKSSLNNTLYKFKQEAMERLENTQSQ